MDKNRILLLAGLILLGAVGLLYWLFGQKATASQPTPNTTPLDTLSGLMVGSAGSNVVSATPTPSPTPSATATPSPTPSATATPSSTPAPSIGTLSISVSYNPTTGIATITPSGVNGTIEYNVPGLQGWSSNQVLTVPTYQRNSTTFTVSASTSTGQTAQTTFAATAPGSTPAPTPSATPSPTPSASIGTLSISVSYNPNTGIATITAAGANGTIEYNVPGLQGWSSNQVLTVPTYQRNGTTFTVSASTSTGQTAQTTFMATAPGSTPAPTPTPSSSTPAPTPTPEPTNNPSTDQPPSGSGSSIIEKGMSAPILDLIDEWRDGKARLRNRANVNSAYYWINGGNAITDLSTDYTWEPSDEVYLYMAITNNPDPWQANFEQKAWATVILIEPNNAV